MSNRDNNPKGETPTSSTRRPPRAVVHNADSETGEGEGNAPRSAAPPARSSARSVGNVPELRMPTRELTEPKTAIIWDAQGRKLTVKKINAMDRLNMYEAAGPKMSGNDGWMGMAAVAISCIAIDDDPVLKPMSASEIKAIVARVEQDGLDAIQHVYTSVWGVGTQADETDEEATVRNAKN